MSLMRMTAKSRWRNTLVVGQLLLLALYPGTSAHAQTAPVGNGFANNATLVQTDGTPNPNFGQISYTRTPARQIQVALRYTF